MKRNFLLLLFAIIICLPATQAQLLTEVADTTRESEVPDYYVMLGTSLRLTTGNKQMRSFYEGQGFEDFRMNELWTFGFGKKYGERFSLDFIVDYSPNVWGPDDINLGNEVRLSLRETRFAFNSLIGYRFWQKRYSSFYFQAGYTLHSNRVEMVERLREEFDFNTANVSNPRGVRSIPVFYHSQRALHAAIKWRISYPRSRRLGTGQDIKLGFVSALRAKPWSVSGQAINTPMDRLQYVYMSGTLYFYPRSKQYSK